ncbi:uncharacterized protein ACN2A1_015172 isoform 1-T2 [Glossina fuscipes fuscipes]
MPEYGTSWDYFISVWHNFLGLFVGLTQLPVFFDALSKARMNKRDEELSIRPQELQLQHRHTQLNEELNLRLSCNKLDKSSADVAAEGAILNEILEIVEFKMLAAHCCFQLHACMVCQMKFFSVDALTQTHGTLIVSVPSINLEKNQDNTCKTKTDIKSADQEIQIVQHHDVL